MSLRSTLLPPETKKSILSAYKKPPLAEYAWALRTRVNDLVQSGGLTAREDTCDFAYHAWYRMGEVALAWALWGEEPLAAWLRAAVARLAHLTDQEWSGPWFRAHREPPVGHLETAHYAQALYAALDLASEALTAELRQHALDKLAGTALPQCLRWLDQNRRSNHNWRMVLTSGLTVSAVLLDDPAALGRAREEIERCLQFFESDGSYGEPYQYWTYGAMNLNLAIEALRCSHPAHAQGFDEEGLRRGVEYVATAWIGNRPADRISQRPVPRVANFGDCAAFFRPSADLLLSLAARHRDALARWLFDRLYGDPSQEAVGGGLSGTYTRLSYLGFLRLPDAPAGAPPELERARRFDNGNMFLRDAVAEPVTFVAIRGYATPRLSAHTHADFGTFILAHRGEILLADPGHSCYRSALFQLHDRSTSYHNVWTFDDESGSHEQAPQSYYAAVEDGRVRAGTPGRALCTFDAPTGIYAAATALEKAYPQGIAAAGRLFLRLGDHALLVVDAIEAERPIVPSWHFILNDRDGALRLKTLSDRIVFRRNDVGAKLFSLSPALGPCRLSFCHVHDYYEVEPGQPGEGRGGTGKRITWPAKAASTKHLAAFLCAFDTQGRMPGWHLRSGEDGHHALESPAETWRFRIDEGAVEVETGDRRLVFRRAGAIWTVS